MEEIEELEETKKLVFSRKKGSKVDLSELIKKGVVDGIERVDTLQYFVETDQLGKIPREERKFAPKQTYYSRKKKKENPKGSPNLDYRQR